MTVQEAVNRGNNLVSTGILALAGFAFMPEIFLETEWHFKSDDIALLILGIISIFWYKRGNNRFTRSKTPIILIAIALVVKFGAIFLEFKDKEDVGDDFGALILFILSFVFVLMLYLRNKKSAEK